MYDLSLEAARRQFETLFSHVYEFRSETHRIGRNELFPARTPNGKSYMIVRNGTLVLEAENRVAPLPERDAIAAWSSAVISLWRLMGAPSYLYWRTGPAYDSGFVYSRFAMSHDPPFDNYAGRPIKSPEHAPLLQEVSDGSSLSSASPTQGRA
jgi:hypothetical protein